MCSFFLKKFRSLPYTFYNRLQKIFFFFEKVLNFKKLINKLCAIIKKKKKTYSLKNFKLLKFFISIIQKRTFLKNKKIKIFHNIKLSIKDSFKLYLINNFKNLNQFFFKSNKKTILKTKFRLFLLNCFIKNFFKLKKKQSYLKNNSLKILKNNSPLNLYFCLLGKTFNFGKKIKWNSSLLSIFELLSFTFNYTISFLISKIFIRLYTSVELKKVLSRKRVTFLPFFIKIKRSAFLTLKWIFIAALKNINITSFKNKLYLELIQIISLSSSFAIQLLEENNENSFKNRANMHYRWQKTR